MVQRSDGQALARKHLDNQLLELPTVRLSRPPRGWVRAIRDALGLTSRQLGARMNRAHTTITSLEKGEIAGTVSLNTLREAAEALDCTLVYALVPNRSLDATVRAQARLSAEKRLKHISHSMTLEDQAVRGRDAEEQLERLADEILRKGGSALWDLR